MNSLSVKSDVEQSLRWIAECTKSHDKCLLDKNTQTNNQGGLPTRVLDITLAPTKVKLYESKHEVAEYACLSHCWGTSTQFQTTKATLEAFKQDIEWDILPTLFQDAILFTHKIGLRYLWIDSICIVQDDRLDWRNEAASMWSIYRGSFLTIAATRCRNNSDSLFSTDKDATQAHPRPSYSLTPSYPLMTRGWIFQERLLSRRVVHFGDHELFWECMEAECCECGELEKNERPPQKSIHHRKPRDRTKKQRCRIWHELVEEYTRLDLKFASDRLPAINGIASELMPHREGQYIAGLWEDAVGEDLCWKCRTAADLPRKPKSVTLAPTWSWASVNAPCEFFSLDVSSSVKILDIQMPDLSRVSDDARAIGCLTLHVHMLSARAVHIPSRDDDGFYSRIYIGEDHLWQFWADYPLWQAGEGYISPEEELLCFPVGSYHTREAELIVRCVDKERQLYERIGITSRNDRYEWTPIFSFYAPENSTVIHLV